MKQTQQSEIALQLSLRYEKWTRPVGTPQLSDSTFFGPLQAEAAKSARILRAESEATARIKEAEADAECRHLAGRGIANARRAIVAGLQDSVVAFKHDVSGASASEVMQFILNTQYYDTLKEVAQHAKHSVIMMPPTAQNPSNAPSAPALDAIAESIQRGTLVAQLAASSHDDHASSS
jgi:regulator of protease activity HflC (stomatin/prohibitin superfamily)